MAPSFADNSARAFAFVDIGSDLLSSITLLWPAWMYRVHCRIRRSVPLNVIERAVLGLVRAGVDTPELIAEHLDLHPDLIAHVQHQLIDRSMLERRGILSPEGLSALGYGEQDWDQYTVAHVFQDPFLN
jgi:hypothetical protein